MSKMFYPVRRRRRIASRTVGEFPRLSQSRPLLQIYEVRDVGPAAEAAHHLATLLCGNHAEH